MSLRLRLVLTLILVAVLPMAVALSVPLLRAENQADREAEERLALRRREAATVVEQVSGRAASRVTLAADDLRADQAAQRALLVGPESAARPPIQRVADRRNLVVCEVVNAEGVVLASLHRGSGVLSPFADLPCREGVAEFRAPEAVADEEGPRAVFLGCRPIAMTGESLRLIAGVALDASLVEELHEWTGEPCALLDASGAEVLSAGLTRRSGLISAAVPLGETGWRVVVYTRAGDAARIRREVLSAFAGVAALAVIGALVLGVLLAVGIVRPIRRLVQRAETIARERTLRIPILLGEYDEVHRLTFSLHRLLDSLLESERQRLAAERLAAWQDIARRIAHEVKNPLSPIKLAVENLRRTREKAPADFDRALKEETGVILEEVEGLRRLVDEFSEFARLPRPQPASCSPRQLVQGALALFTGRIAELGVEVRVEDASAPEAMVADAEQLKRALKNVVANALEAMASVSERRLAVVVRRLLAPAGPLIEFEIRDTGPGLSPEARSRAFEPYFTTRAASGGTGLGLSIAHRIVADHGGTIEISGEPGRGATVIMRLPQDGPPCPRS